MTQETDKTVKSTDQEFTIPIGLLKKFENDIRWIPGKLPANGWIIFDHKMLVTTLVNGSDIERKQLANELEKMYGTGGKLVIMQG